MCLLADENVPVVVTTVLRRTQHDVVLAREAGLAGHQDQELLAYAEREGRVLLTGDKDFGGLLEFGPLHGRGKVILLRYVMINMQRISKDLIEILKKESRILRGPTPVLIVLSEGRYRIHRFSKKGAQGG